MSNRELLERAYSSPESVPWNDPRPPQELVVLIDTKKIVPCKALEIGCGAGHHSIYLAKRGFEVTAIDISKKAIEYAKNNAKKNKVKATFKALNALEIDKLEGKFDFVFEWGVLHFIPFALRENYIKDVANLLVPGGKYISLSFNLDSPEWGTEKIRTGITGSTIYYSSMNEIESLFKPYFKILEKKLRHTRFANSGNKHIHNYFLAERR